MLNMMVTTGGSDVWGSAAKMMKKATVPRNPVSQNQKGRPAVDGPGFTWLRGSRQARMTRPATMAVVTM